MERENNRYDSLIPRTIFHYTSFEKFKSILQYGTWRFKLSTQSNDLLDTKYIIEIIKQLKVQSHDLPEDNEKLLDHLMGYFKRDAYERQYLSYVSCFTDKDDSRLLWDAYTINRPTVSVDDIRDYNGVCIGINRDKFLALLEREKPDFCDSGLLSPVFYTPQKQILALDFLFKDALNYFDKLKAEKDQSQKVIPKIKTAFTMKMGKYVGKPHYIEIQLKKSFVNTMFSFIESVEKTAPFLKHQFWEEENEYRAALNLRKSKKPDTDFIDIKINADLIDFIILGPSFSDKDVQYIQLINDAKIDFNTLNKKQSIGTGVICIN